MLRRLTRIPTIVAVLAAILIGTPALAGPLLVCHPYDIGDARSLPWNEKYVWSAARPDYDLEQLVADTEALLTPTTPIVVRLETLRRAAIYASHDRRIATQLLDRLNARVESSRQAGRTQTLALVDAAYLRATFHQIALMKYEAEFRERAANVQPLTGRDEALRMIEEAVRQHAEDPAIQFAAALITFGWNEPAYKQYAHDTQMAAARDPLVARNVTLLR
jgi:hypothetical protein